MELKKHLLPVFFIIVFILGIYFILFKKEKEYYQNQLFAPLQQNEEHFAMEKKEHFENNLNPYFKSLVNGYWTFFNTSLNGNKIKGMLIKIVLNDDLSGYVSQVFDRDWNKENKKMNITSVQNNIIYITYEGGNWQFDFNEESTNPNPLKMEKIPMMKITSSSPIFNTIKSMNSFKIYDPNMDMGGKLSRIIQSRQFFNTFNVQQKYDMNTYNKYLNYKYPDTPFKIEYNGMSYPQNKNNTFYQKLKEEYNNKIYLCYQREYVTVDSEVVRTPLSQRYTINAFFDKNYFSKIILNNIQEENTINNIKKPFILKNTYIYIYLLKKDNKMFTLKKFLPNDISMSSLGFQYNLYPKIKNFKLYDIQNLEITDKSEYNLQLLNKYIMTSNDMEITILPEDIQNKILKETLYS